MIAVDTNILVRLVTNDDPQQVKRVEALFSKGRIFIAKTVLLEMEWVLRHAYSLEKTAIQNAFQMILGLPQVEVEDVEQVATALLAYEGGLDFADALHLASSCTADWFFTFDEKLNKKSGHIGARPPVALA